MGIRVNRLLSELNIGFQTLNDWLKALGYKEEILSINTKILLTFSCYHPELI